MVNLINERVILSIKQSLPKDKLIADVLMDLLSLSKESVYRRLRGDICFTLDELVTISNRLGISIDDIIDSGTITTKWAILNLDKLFLFENYVTQYCERIEGYINILQNMQSAKRVNAYSACNIVPHSFLLSHKKLSQFWHYKWIYMMKKANPNYVFSNMILPEKLIETERRFIDECQNIPKETIILDKDAFSHLVNDILFFVHQELISQTDLIQLKQELLGLISEIETIAETGCYKTGAEVMIYLSKINIDTCYYYLEYDEKMYCYQQTFFVDRLEFNNERLCRRHKEWIDLLRRFSFLLTQSGDKERCKFYNDQRRLINSMS